MSVTSKLKDELARCRTAYTEMLGEKQRLADHWAKTESDKWRAVGERDEARRQAKHNRRLADGYRRQRDRERARVEELERELEALGGASVVA